MSKTAKTAADYILPLNMNGLSGRMLRMPPPKNSRREIMFVYGHHSSLERWFGVAEYLNNYAGVTVPDLPGFGGMESFYKIGEKANLDNMADYLAAFIKLRFKNKNIMIVGMSLGFVLVTRMFQKYPELTKKVDLFVSQSGFTHKNDFRFSKFIFYSFKWGSTIISRRLPAWFVQHVIFSGPVLRAGYAVLEPRLIDKQHSKMEGASGAERRARIDFEIQLWKINEARTYAAMALEMFKLNLTKEHVALPIYHVSVGVDRYFDQISVEQHMRTVFKDFIGLKAKATAHAPSVILTAKEAAPFVPPELRKILKSKSN